MEVDDSSRSLHVLHPHAGGLPDPDAQVVSDYVDMGWGAFVVLCGSHLLLLGLMNAICTRIFEAVRPRVSIWTFILAR